MTLLDYIKYYRKDSFILNDANYSGSDTNNNLLKKKLKKLGYKNKDITIFIDMIKNIEKFYKKFQ